MNILFVYREDNSIMYSWPKVHFRDELSRHGHDIFVFNLLNHSTIDEANERLCTSLKSHSLNCDLIVYLDIDDNIRKETILEIKKQSIPQVQFCPDNLHAPFLHRNNAPLVDLVWLTSIETKSLFEKWGCKCVFLPYAANPYTFKPEFAEEIRSVGFIGTPYGTRINKINNLTDNDIPCSVYSDKLISNDCQQDTIIFRRKQFLKFTDYELTGWRFDIGRKILLSKFLKRIIHQPQELSKSQFLNIFPSVTNEQMNSLYSNLSLSLNITEVWDTLLLKQPVHKLHLRTFEIPMCGGLQFAPYINELAEYFDDNKEIVMYKSKDEYIDKAKYYLRDDMFEKRTKMKHAARLRAEQEHTWTKRFKKIFELLKL